MGEGGSVFCGETESRFESPFFTGLGGSIGFDGSVCRGLIERRMEECRPGEDSLADGKQTRIQSDRSLTTCS